MSCLEVRQYIEYHENRYSPFQFNSSALTSKQLYQLFEDFSQLIIYTFKYLHISTASGIPDFRSGMGTVLQTGPGAWEKSAQQQQQQQQSNQKPQQKYQTVSMLKALPSQTHMALVKLEQLGILKFLISQNVDGLHRRSGFPPEKMAELHGNTNLEKCDKCGKEFLRDYRVRTAQQVHDHKTGRKCDNPKCSGQLHDSIINFGEDLPSKDLDEGFVQCQLADLCLVMGSSLRVTPAADMPKVLSKDKNKNLVIVNIQLTPLDDICSLRIFALCDKVIEKLMKALSIEVDPFLLRRVVSVLQTEKQILLQGIDITDECPYSFIKEVHFSNGKEIKIAKKEPFQTEIPVGATEMGTKLFFFGHYEEPELSLHIPLLNLEEGQIKKRKYQLDYNASEGQWVSICEL